MIVQRREDRDVRKRGWERGGEGGLVFFAEDWVVSWWLMEGGDGVGGKGGGVLMVGSRGGDGVGGRWGDGDETGV